MLNCEIGLDFLDNEPALVDGLQVGSQEAFETLVRLYQAPIYNLAYRILGDSSEASEATQEAFVRIYKGIGRFRGECGLKTWIYRIAVSASLNRRRWWKRWKDHVPASLDQPLPSYRDSPRLLEVPDRRPDPEAACARRETEQAVQRALDALPADYRTVVVLRDIEGFTYEEIAESLAISMGTVKSRLWRARSQLRQRLRGLIEQGSGVSRENRDLRSVELEGDNQ